MSRYCVVILLCLFIQATSGCKGMKIYFKNIKNCGKNPVLEYVNSTVRFNEKCEVIVDGCSTVHKFSNASFKAKALKDSMTMFEKSAELCSERSELARIGFAFIGIVDKCTVPANMTKCYENQRIFTLSKSTIRLMPSFMLGRSFFSVRVEISHDTGRSCFEGDFIVKKEK